MKTKKQIKEEIASLEQKLEQAKKELIEQYLPDGHPDKIVSDKEGKYFTTLEGGIAWRIYKIKSMNKHWATVSHYINIEGERYTTKYVVSMDERDRPSTKEEIKWLDACIKAGKFISKEEALETEEERLLKEAKKRYPVGTTITPFNSSRMIGNPTQVTVDKDDHHFYMGYIWAHTGKWSAIIYRDGEWAEIIPEVKKWDVGTYVVFIKGYGRSKIGYIDKIVESNIGIDGCLCEKELITTKDEEYVKWFATKEEAEEFAKTLIPQLSVGDYFVSESYSKHVGRITEIYNDGTRYRYWGFSVLGPFRENDWYDFSDTKPRKATDKEIKEFLSNVAKYKYSVGVWVDQAVAYPKFSNDKFQIKNTDVIVSSSVGHLNVSIGGVGVFNEEDGIWAPIIPAPFIDLPFGELTFTIDRNAKTAKCKFGTITKEEIEQVLEWAYPSIEMLGYPLTLEDNTIIHFGCQKGSIKEAQAILDAFE